MIDARGPVDGGPLRRAMRWLAIAWLLVVVAVACHQWRFWQQSRLDSDVMALLPQDRDAPDVSGVLRRIADPGSRDVVVMLGAERAEQALSLIHTS